MPIDTTRRFTPVRIAVLTVSDTRSLAEDRSGDTLVGLLTDAGHELADRTILRDDADQIGQVNDLSVRDGPQRVDRQALLDLAHAREQGGIEETIEGKSRCRHMATICTTNGEVSTSTRGFNKIVKAPRSSS